MTGISTTLPGATPFTRRTVGTSTTARVRAVRRKITSIRVPFQRRGTSWPIPPHFRQGIHARSGVLGFVMNLKGVRYCMNQAVNDCATTSSEVEQSVSQEIYTNNLQAMIRAATSGRVTASHPNSEVKLPRVSVVLRWGTTREGDMLHVLGFFCEEKEEKCCYPDN